MLTTLKELLPYAVAVSAIAAAVSAFFAARAARATRKNAQGNLAHQLLTEYAADEMGDAVRALAQLTGFTAGTGEPPQLTPQLESKRRLFSHYMQKVHTLHELGVIDRKVLSHVAPKKNAIVFLAIEPIEALIARDYDRSSFAFYGNHYRLRRERLRPVSDQTR